MEFDFVDIVLKFFGDWAQTEFTKTLAIFTFAAYVHSKQVRKEVRAQFDKLVSVLQQDLDANKIMLGKLASRIDNIEGHLKIREEQNGIT